MAEEFKAAEVYVEFTTRGDQGVEQQIERINQKAKKTPKPTATSATATSAEGKKGTSAGKKGKKKEETFRSAATKIGVAIGAAVASYLATVKAGVSLASPQTMERLSYEMDRFAAIIGEHAIPLFEGLAKRTRQAADTFDYMVNGSDSFGRKIERLFDDKPIKSNKELMFGQWADLRGMRDKLQTEALRGLSKDPTSDTSKQEAATTSLGKFIDAVDTARKKINDGIPVLKWITGGILDPLGLGRIADISRMLNG